MVAIAVVVVVVAVGAVATMAAAAAAADAAPVAAAPATSAGPSAQWRQGKKKKDFHETWKSENFRRNIEKTNGNKKTLILEELGESGWRHQILHEKLPIWTYFQVCTIENGRK